MGRARRRPSTHEVYARISPDMPGWVLLGLLSVTFLLGGGARADILSLVILRPLAAISLVYALYKVSGVTLGGHKKPIWLFGAWLVMVALQLIPLPARIWTSLPGRENIVLAIEAVGEAPGWHPLSVVPSATFNGLFALFLPLAILLLYAASSEIARLRALHAVCLFAFVSATFGMLQVVSGLSILYLYDISNHGMPIGFFSNRNHQAAMIAAAIPLILAVAANKASRRNSSQAVIWLARGLCLGLAIIAVMTGSRTGTLLSILMLVIGSLLIAPIEHSDRKPAVAAVSPAMLSLIKRIAVPFILIAVIGAVFLVVQGTAFERLASKDGLEDLRFAILPTIITAVREALPLGYGVGTFPQVYEMFEQSELIQPSYVNHAHNDWVEIFLEGGAFLALVGGFGLAWLLARCWELRATLIKPVSDGDRLRLAAVLGIVVFLAASITDYPLRTPIVAAVFMVLVGRLATARKSS